MHLVLRLPIALESPAGLPAATHCHMLSATAPAPCGATPRRLWSAQSRQFSWLAGRQATPRDSSANANAARAPRNFRSASTRLKAATADTEASAAAQAPAAAAATEDAAPLLAAGAAQAAPAAEFAQQHDVPLGTLLVRAVQADDVGPASVLLTRAFAGSLQGVPIQDARQYCLDSLTQPPRGVLLVARLTPADDSLLPPGQASRLVATTGLSFCRDTREEFPTLQPPDDAVYLSNMAVDAKLRRQGLARLMLAAAESLAASRGFESIYLHARLSDAPAQQLYLSSGYEVVDKDNALFVKLRGITPRTLMRKSLRQQSSGRQ